METVQLDAIGCYFVATIKEAGAVVPISTVTEKQLVFRKPNGVTVTQDAEFATDGLNGKIQYASVAGDLDVAGIWELQGFVTFPGGFSGRSDKQRFWVKPNL